jgi:peptide/nickel transport system ATP-binding protein
MYAGRMVEQARAGDLFRTPRHPYTRGLMASIPHLGSSLQHDTPPRLSEISGIVPSLVGELPGCAFADRCGFVTERCRRTAPQLEEMSPGHTVACFETARVVAA